MGQVLFRQGRESGSGLRTSEAKNEGRSRTVVFLCGVNKARTGSRFGGFDEKEGRRL